MNYNFDRIVNRRNTQSYKWDQLEKLFGNKDIMPLWVADMDFESPPAVRKALENRAVQGIYGYCIRSDEYINSIIRWFLKRHDWDIKPHWLTDTPSVVTALSMAVELFSEPGSSVILQSPVYYPFYDVIRMNGRQVAKNPLVIRNGRYEMDYPHLEQLMRDGAKLLLLCSPHNPGGRVWERDELLKLAGLCLRYNVMVVSDEIHCDLVFPGHKHIPFAALSEDVAQITLTCLAPTKTFNLPGLHSSFIAASNMEMKRKFDDRLKALSLHMTNFFTPCAVQAAYDEGEVWLDEMLVYVEGNINYAIEYFSEHLPQVKPIRPDGTYLLWVDCRGLGLDVNDLKDLMFEKAGVVFNEGSVFGTEEGKGYVRINLACPRSILQEALKRFCQAARG